MTKHLHRYDQCYLCSKAEGRAESDKWKALAGELAKALNQAAKLSMGPSQETYDSIFILIASAQRKAREAGLRE